MLATAVMLAATTHEVQSMKKPSSSKSKATTAPARKVATQHRVTTIARAESKSAKKPSNEALSTESVRNPSSVKSEETKSAKSTKPVATPATRKASGSALSAKKPSTARANNSVTKGRSEVSPPWEVEVASDVVGKGRSGARGGVVTDVEFRVSDGSVLSGSAGRKSIPQPGGSQKRTVTEIKEKKARLPSSRSAKIFLDEVSRNVKAKKTESLSDLATKKRSNGVTEKPSSSVPEKRKESPDNRAKRLREEGAAKNLAESAYDGATEHLEQESPSKRRHSTTPARYTPSAKQPGKKDREPPARSRIHDPLPTAATFTSVKKRKPEVVITDEIIEFICGHIAEGTALYKVLEIDPDNLPSRGSFFRHVATNSTWAAMYSAAVNMRGEYFADQISELADEARGQDSDEIQAIKLQVNTRQWLASRLLPKRYGDKMIVAGDADNPLVTQLVQGAEALKRKIKGERNE